MTRIAVCLLAITIPTMAHAQERLSLDEAVRIMLEESEDLKTAVLVVESAALSPASLYAAYDWNGQAELGISRDEAPRTSGFEPQTVTTVPLSASVTRLFPSGTYVEASLTGSYFDAPFANLPFPIEGQIERGWRQGLSITATQPLLGSSQPKLLVLQREEITKNVMATAASVAEGVEQGVAGVHRLFWAAALSEEALLVAQDSLKSAEELRDLVASRVRRGAADSRDLLLAEAGVQQAQMQVLNATRASDQARRGLLDLMGVSPDAFSGVDYDVMRVVPGVAEGVLTEQGVESSLGLQTLQAQLEATEAGQLRAREEMRGALSAVGVVTQSGLFPSGTGLADDAGYTAFGGMRYRQSFGNVGQRIRMRQAEIDRRRIESQIARKKQQIRAAAGEHTAAIVSARVQITEAEKLVETATKRFETEQRNFRIGRIALRDLVDARNMVTQAKYSLAIGRVSLQMASSERALLDGSMTSAYREQILKDLKMDGSMP